MAGHWQLVAGITPSALLRLLPLLLLSASSAAGLQCYQCSNRRSSACGQYFKAYQFSSFTCDNVEGVKCGKQEQNPLDDGWVGVMRGCYKPGMLPGLNETNGCHEWYSVAENFTATYCLCDTDLCNAASDLPSSRSSRAWLFLPAVLVVLLSGPCLPCLDV